MSFTKLDKRDIAILKTLSAEGRISKTALADRVNLSATACWDRLQRLESSGLIKGYHAEVELRKLAPHVTVFVLAELANHNAEAFQTFEKIVQRHPEITGCWALGGGFDYLLQVISRDIESYQQLIETVLEEDAGLARYFTYIVTKAVKNAALPFDLLFDA
ncbi:Lrp/AsnC family transcriptional regulator [Neptunicoccus cionae]|uniref:Lrp/AsnC family transcriptional regulator n=1 Tax=Neptunicoccus cionae TaxID=2035344 RepID=UPI000C76CAB8|nr:Lrp/AsnC family transcriptional regulator [Amylibacter cionae]PLS21523.1 AsnC family transcriptional regulator [Amylibacter cionae]